MAIAYNLFYAFAFPIYNTANSTLVPVSTRNSQHRSALASFTNIASLGVMGAGSMVFPILISNVLQENQTRWFIVMVGIAIFTALTIFAGYDATASSQFGGVQSIIGVSYIWIETVAYALCALLITVWTVEKNLPEEQAAIAARKQLTFTIPPFSQTGGL